MTTVTAPGLNDPDFSRADIDLGMLEEAKPAVEVLGNLRIDVSRSSGDPARIDKAKADTIVELVLEGDLRWITTVDRLQTDFPEQIDRSSGGGGDFRLPSQLGRMALRGGGGSGLDISSAAFFDLDADQLVKLFTGDPAAKAGEIAGDILGPKIAEWFDKRQIEAPGLYRLDPVGDGIRLREQKTVLPASEEPYLLFLHGTASTTAGSFGGLWTENRSVWGRIGDRYQGRMLALEHHTLAESPIANALMALEKLPTNAKLHLVSHSRGGMIGELLCRSGRTTGGLFDDVDFQQLEQEGYLPLKDQLIAFHNMLFEKSITVERFVRVACPAAGTTLAGGKLDRWLSTLMNVVGKVGADAFALYRFIRGFTLAVVETRTEPEHVPGLEAMMPGSPLTKILNRPDITTNADLSAIAGDINGKGVFYRLGVWLTDLYFQGDHDLVVDTASMYGGQKRAPGQARSFFDEGPEVYHFRYFKNEKTAAKVWDGLRRSEPEAKGQAVPESLGFSALPSPPELKDLRSRSGEPRPSVFMLPGILGSELGYGDNRIWMDLKDIFRGRLERLDLHRENPKEIKPFRMFPRYYNELANFLAATHDVMPFPYDWRISMRDEADRFAGELTKRLDGSTQPVRILAHSMGGLLARLAFARHADLWQRFKAKEGCRLVMLGTPNEGSFSIPRMLMGRERTTGLLALLDIRNSEKDLLDMIRRFPGVLELLPASGHHDFFDEHVWKTLDDTDGRGWQEPLQQDLDIARATWRLLDNAPIDGTRMVFVAGQAESTPVGLTIDGDRVRFQATRQGDGRVPWASIPKELPTFYIAAAHGDMPRHEQAFGGYLDLLQQGTTRLLSSRQPVDRGAAMPFDLPDDRPSIYPDAEALEAAALGGRGRYVAAKAVAQPTTLQVRHGDLTFSSFPVMVGHYEQDILIGAERSLDKSLGQRLSQRYQRGLYPGAIDTAEVILDDEAFPPGAIVIGLGEVGSLTVGKLRRALLHGLRRYCLTQEEKWLSLKGTGRTSASDTTVGQATNTPFGLSTLIIGSGDGGLSMSDALSALLDAVLELQREGRLAGLRKIEIIEYFEHKAIQAMRELEVLRNSPRYAGQLDISTELMEGEGGQRKLVLESDQGWSQRISIKGTETSDQRYRGLHFAVLTGRARIEDSVVADTLKLADAFINAAIEQSAFGGQASPGRTLFELLLPLRLKLASDDDRNLVLMLDQIAAGYPWELLEDRSGDGAEPPAIRAGLIRQLHDERFRPDVMTTAQRTALVVGDPDPIRPNAKFPPLDGAVSEARTVANLINRAGYAVDEEIRTRPTAAIASLMSGSYRILHLAGHGVFEERIDAYEPTSDEGGDQRKTCPQTGMVLGDGLLWTAGAVNQLTHVPELVFLNCCYLGQINARAEKTAATRFHELAANLATQFIRIGAKAVIAAGWAVDDSAATTFATTFYRAMLEDGAEFIDAVTQARRQTYMAHPNTNTWGAYQAYGDPSFTLNGKKSGGRRHQPSWYQPYEAVLAFNELTQKAQAVVQSDLAYLREQFDERWRRTPAKWRKRSDILAAKARAAGELGLFSEAISAYDRAIAGDQSEAPIRAIEQRANLRARYALFLRKGKVTPSEDNAEAPLDMIIRSMDELDGLRKLQNVDDSAKGEQEDSIERLSILGSASKRACQLYVTATETAAAKAGRTAAPDEEQIDWLKKAARFYKDAHDLSSTNSYALTNWLSISAIISLRGGKLGDDDVVPPSISRQEGLLLDAAGAEDASDLERPDFWKLSARGDMALTRLLFLANDHVDSLKGRRTAKDEKTFEALVSRHETDITDNYIKAWKRGGSFRSMNSILEQLDFLIDALSIGSAASVERRRLIAAIKSIESEIAKMTGSPG